MEWPRLRIYSPARVGAAYVGHSWNLVIIPGGIWCGTARIGVI